MKVTAIIEWWDDGTVSAYVPDFDRYGFNGQGKSVNEAKASMESCLEEYKEMFAEKGEPLPSELEGLEFEYKYDIPSFFDCFKFINVSAFAEYAGINPSLMRQYKNRLAFASEAQKAKIAKAIQRAGAAMVSAKL